MLRAAVVLLMLLVLPLATAAAPLAGELEWGDDARVDGAVEARAPVGILNLSADALRGLRVSWGAAHGYRLEFIALRSPTAQEYQEDTDNESLSWGAGTLEVLSCDHECTVLAWTEGGDDGAVGLAGNASGPFERAQGRQTEGEATRLASVRVYLPEDWLSPPPMEDAVPVAEGRIHLAFKGALVRIQHAGGARDVWTGNRSESPNSPLLPILLVNRSAEVQLLLEDASLAVRPGSEATLKAPALDLAVAGEARADAATGWVSLGGRRVDLSNEPVVLAGDGMRIHLAPRVVQGQSSTLGGEADRVTVAGGTLQGRTPAQAAVAPVVVGSGLLALLLAWRFLAPLYSRLTKDVLLGNENRARVYAAVRDNPGAHVAAISRATGIGRVVVQHHLRMLEAHRLVVRRQGPKLLTYFAADGILPPDEERARAAIHVDARRSIAAAIAASPDGLTQRDLEERLALSRRLVGYHLAKLEAAGLVRREGFLPARFVAHERLHATMETVSTVAATDRMET